MTPFIMPATKKKPCHPGTAIPVGSAGVGYDRAPVGRRSGVGYDRVVSKVISV